MDGVLRGSLEVFKNTLGEGGMFSLVLLVWRWVMALVPGYDMSYGVEIIL